MMAHFDIGGQSAENIYQAETLHVHSPPAETDHVAVAMRAFRVRNYPAACQALGTAVAVRPDDPELNYYLGLSLLRGNRPHLHTARSVDEISAHLRVAAGDLPEAASLLMLVTEDYTTAWRRHVTVPREVIDLVRRVPIDRAREVIEHIAAPESQLWKLLALRAEGNLS